MDEKNKRLEVPLSSCVALRSAYELTAGTKADFARAAGMLPTDMGKYMRSKELGGTGMTVDKLAAVLAANGLRARIVIERDDEPATESAEAVPLSFTCDR